MTPYRKDGKPGWMIGVPTRPGYIDPRTHKPKTRVQRSAGTQDRATATAIEAMVKLLGKRGRQQWEYIDPVIDRKLSLSELYYHYARGTLDALKHRLNDVDLRPGVEVWKHRIIASLAPETSRHYGQQVDKLFPGDDAIWRSTVTTSWLKAQLAAVAGSNTNKRRYGAAWMSLLDDLTEQGFLAANPMRSVTLPPSNPSKVPHLLMVEAQQLVSLMPAGAHRALAAFRYGAGIELQATKLRRRDIVDEGNRVMWAHGTKNAHRDRQVIVEAWAFTIIMEYVRRARLLPDAVLFPVTTRSHADTEREALVALMARKAVGPLSGATGRSLPLEAFTAHAACHTYCIDGMKRGVDPVLLANNRGHANTQMVLALYGKFRPTVMDLVRADQRAGGTK